MSETRDRIQRLVDHLEKLADPKNPNRAVLAHLRRGLREDAAYTLSRAGWLFAGFHDQEEEDAAILTAGLFAWAKGKCPQVENISIGKAFARIPGAGDNPSIERRFIDLLDTDRTDVNYKLRQVVSLLAQHSIGLDWALLCRQILFWNDSERRAQKLWAQDFWRFVAAETVATFENETTDS